jgi:hypothetical protein
MMSKPPRAFSRQRVLASLQTAGAFVAILVAWQLLSIDLEGLRRAERNSGRAILDAFRIGVSPIPDRETLEITKILCAARIAAGSGTTIKLANL